MDGNFKIRIFEYSTTVLVLLDSQRAESPTFSLEEMRRVSATLNVGVPVNELYGLDHDLDLDSTCIQEDVLGHTPTSF